MEFCSMAPSHLGTGFSFLVWKWLQLPCLCGHCDPGREVGTNWSSTPRTGGSNVITLRLCLHLHFVLSNDNNGAAFKTWQESGSL